MKKSGDTNRKTSPLRMPVTQRGKREQKKARPRRRLTLKELLIILIPAAATICVVLFTFLSHKEAMRYTLRGDPVQYYNHGIYTLQEGMVLQRTGEEKTIANTGTKQRDFTSLPVYFRDRASILLPDDMVYYDPRGNVVGRIGYFTEITMDSHGAIYAERNGNRTRLQDGFLFDGNDLYVFLEPMEVTLNGYQTQVSALSFVDAVYRGEIMVFDYEKKDFLQEPTTEAVTAQTVLGDYSLSLLADSMTNHLEQRTLLFTRPELLDPVI